MKVSCITVNTNERHYLRHLLQGIHDAVLAIPYEYFVVDNGSHDGSLEMLDSQFPWVKAVALPQNIGLGPAANQALRYTSGEYVLFLNPDLTLFAGEIEKWVAWMDAHPDVGVSGPRLLNPDRTDQESCFSFPTLFTPVYRRTFFGMMPWGKRAIDRYLRRGMDRDQEQDVDWVLGAAMLIRRELLERIGRFDERFFLYFEDADVCHRVWKAGSRVMYVPSVRLIHYYQRQSRTRFFWQGFFRPIARIHLASGVKYFLKYRGQPYPRISLPS